MVDSPLGEWSVQNEHRLTCDMSLESLAQKRRGKETKQTSTADSGKTFSSHTGHYQVIIIDLTQSTINSASPADTAPASGARFAQSRLISVSYSWCCSSGRTCRDFPAQSCTINVLKIPRTSTAIGQSLFKSAAATDWKDRQKSSKLNSFIPISAVKKSLIALFKRLLQLFLAFFWMLF